MTLFVITRDASDQPAFDDLPRLSIGCSASAGALDAPQAPLPRATTVREALATHERIAA